MFRRARAEDQQRLMELSMRSKAHWGYDEAFMQACREALTPPSEYLAKSPVYVLEEDGDAVGFYGFQLTDGKWVLEDLFVEPGAIGKGYGRALWEHLLATAKAEGMREFTINADPYAEDFYLKMGAEKFGEIPSTAIPGRMLPLMRVTV